MRKLLLTVLHLLRQKFQFIRNQSVRAEQSFPIEHGTTHMHSRSKYICSERGNWLFFVDNARHCDMAWPTKHIIWFQMQISGIYKAYATEKYYNREANLWCSVVHRALWLGIAYCCLILDSSVAMQINTVNLRWLRYRLSPLIWTSFGAQRETYCQKLPCQTYLYIRMKPPLPCGMTRKFTVGHFHSVAS